MLPDNSPSKDTRCGKNRSQYPRSVSYPLYILLLLSTGASISTHAHAGSPLQNVAILDTSECPGSGKYTLQSSRPAESSKLYSGDQIQIKDSKCKLTVLYLVHRSPKTPEEATRFGSIDREDQLEQKSGLYTVSSVKPNSYGDLFAIKIFGDPPAMRDSVVAGRAEKPDSDEISMPILDLWDNQIAAGTRALHLAWRNGESPFDITVAAKGKGPLARTGNVQSRYTRFESLTLQPGTYIVTVKGNTGQQAQATFDVVEPSQIPTPPSELRTTRSENDLLQAGWLASNGHGEYVFEAYQRIIALRSRDKHASRVLEWLEAGWRPRLK